MSHYRFNRHELFTPEDTQEVMALIREVRDLSMDIDDTEMESTLDCLTNMLYGMFDGYLYDNVLTTAVSVPQLSLEVCKRMEAIVDKIVNEILTNGQSTTAVY
jgi:hypothetical protein